MNLIFYYQLRELIFHQISSEDSPLRIILASSALGMGADFGRVERIVHAGPPKSIEGNFLNEFYHLNMYRNKYYSSSELSEYKGKKQELFNKKHAR